MYSPTKDVVIPVSLRKQWRPDLQSVAIGYVLGMVCWMVIAAVML